MLFTCTVNAAAVGTHEYWLREREINPQKKIQDIAGIPVQFSPALRQ